MNLKNKKTKDNLIIGSTNIILLENILKRTKTLRKLLLLKN